MQSKLDSSAEVSIHSGSVCALSSAGCFDREAADTEPAAAHAAARCSHFSQDHLEEPLACSQSMSADPQDLLPSAHSKQLKVLGGACSPYASQTNHCLSRT